MCGTRDAPMSWQDHLQKTLLEMKFKESNTHVGVFQHDTRDIFFCVHVDDLLCTGLREDLMLYTDSPHTSFFSCTVYVFNGVQPHHMAQDESLNVSV